MRSTSVTLTLTEWGNPLQGKQLNHDWLSAPDLPYPQQVFYPNVRSDNRITDANGRATYTFDYNAQTTPGTYTIRFMCSDVAPVPTVTITIIIE